MLPVAHHGDAVAHRQRLVLVVGDVDERDPERLLDALELDLQVHAQARVERAERLVEQQHRRLEHERARQRDALLLAAGELRRAPVRRSPPSAPCSIASPTRRARLGLA